MSGTNDYVNAYIDIAVGTIHENINTILQLKTENILTKSILASKDVSISDLQKRLDDYDSIVSKMNDMNVVIKQYNELKIQYREKEKELESCQRELKKLSEKKTVTPPKKVINNKNTSSTQVEIESETNDDF